MRPILAALALVLLAARPVNARLQAMPLGLDGQVARADLACKATVTGERVVTDPSFEPAPGFEVRETELRVVSVIKGQPAPGTTIRFRHYAESPHPAMRLDDPRHIELVAGKTYLVLAMRDGARYRQPSQSEDFDILLAADARPHHGKTLHAAAWHELTTALDGPAADAMAALGWLDELSGGRAFPRTDFARADVIAAVRPQLAAVDPAVATSAIKLLGHDSPYLDDGHAQYWLAGLRGAWIAGLGVPTTLGGVDPATTAALLATATTGPATTRAIAIRALGHAGAPAASLATWLRDRDPAVRAAAVELCAETRDRAAILAGLGDPAPGVRVAAALAIGFLRDAALAPRLGPLLVDGRGGGSGDGQPTVRRAAALALLSFPAADVAGVLTANLTTQYRALFINALAHHDAAPHLAALAEVITRHLEPTDWWGGLIPAGDAWTTLFHHVASRPAGELTRGALDASLDALERMQWFSSSEPRDLYALYIHRGMTARAAAFRAAIRAAPAASGLTLDHYFDEVDAHPERFPTP